MAVPEAYRGREQTYVKHKLLRNYLDRFGHKIGSKWKCINYVDCFAGPWESAEPGYADTSFGIAVNALSKAQRDLAEAIGRHVRLRFCFIESDPKSFTEPTRYAESKRAANLEIVTLKGTFEDHIQDVRTFVTDGGPKAFRFLLLDPKGWTGFALSKVAPLVEDRSAEILVNVMTYHIRRFVTQEAHASNFEDLFADDTVADEAAALSGTQREQFLVQRYSENLKRMAGFAYTSIAAIFRAAEDTVHYYLVFGTNSAHGVQVFKEAERVAFETGESARHEAKSRKRIKRTGQGELDVFGEGLQPPSSIARNLRSVYREQARGKLAVLLRPGSSVAYDDLLGTVLQTPLIWETDLLGWIDELVEQRRVSITPELGRKKLRISQNYKINGLP